MDKKYATIKNQSGHKRLYDLDYTVQRYLKEKDIFLSSLGPIQDGIFFRKTGFVRGIKRPEGLEDILITIKMGGLLIENIEVLIDGDLPKELSEHFKNALLEYCKTNNYKIKFYE